jgi:hypothetical protein
MGGKFNTNPISELNETLTQYLAWSAFMDFVLAILPWHVVMGLNMKRKEKLTVAFGLSLGILYAPFSLSSALLPYSYTFNVPSTITPSNANRSAGICSIIRTYELQALSSLNEYVYDTVPMLLWSSTEVLATIVCACIPVLRPLYVRVVHGSKGSSSGRTYPLGTYAKSGKKSSGEFPSIGGGKGYGGKGQSGGSRDTGERIYMGPGASIMETTIKMGSDNASEESILREANAQHARTHGLPIQNFEITRTNEIRVESSYKVDKFV